MAAHEEKGFWLPAWVLPIVTSVIALGVGSLFGGVLGWVLKPSTEVEVPRNLTDRELEIACAPMILAKTTEIEEAEEKVSDLKVRVAQKEAKVTELETEMARRSERGRELVLELERAKADLRETKEQLQKAQEEKNLLIETLKETVIILEETEVKLEEQIELTEYAKEDALTNKWYRFVNESQLEICERGNRKKLGKCREAVETLLEVDAIRDQFAHCVRSGQATPSVHELEKKTQLPEFSQFLNQEDRIVREWYLLLCDPTLPERADGMLHEEHLPKSTTSPGNNGFDFNIEDLDDIEIGEPARPKAKKEKENFLEDEEFEFEDIPDERPK
ncbi:MAG: hypothetical protein HN348_08975 [Proteobacteria bacterium]|nr:hypothetical protein [Pseudomonadota bacterium]